MHWLIAIILRVIPASILTPIFIKKVVDSRKDDLELQAKKLSLMFMFCTLFSFFVWLTTGKAIGASFLVLFCMGIFNALANLCKWRAVGIGLVKSYIFFNGKDIIAMILGYVFLSQAKIFNPTVLAGVGLILYTLIIFSVQKYQQESNESQRSGSSSNIGVIGYAIGFSLIWGVLIFLMGYFALNKLPIEEFLLGWYGGSFVGTLGLIQVVKTNNRNRTSQNISKSELLHIIPLSFFVWISLVLAYLAILKSHLNIAQPVLMVSETILPCLIGIWLFKEREGLAKMEKVAVLSGLTGAVLIAIGY